jgi:anti-sigma-K factor RskA
MTTLHREAPERQEIEALLPWHAAGTLNRRDRERVEQAIASDRELARSFELVCEEQHECIHLNESLGAPSARAMEKLFAAIDAEGAKAPARRSFDLVGRVSEFLSGFAPRTLAYAAAAAALVLFAQAAVLTTVIVKDQAGQGLELASYTKDSGLAAIRFTPQASASEITRFLQAYNAVVVDGPKRGLYKIRIGNNEAVSPELSKIVQRMQAETKIVEFIAIQQ